MAGFLKVELIHGAIARDQRQKDTLRGLGLRRRHQQRVLQDTPAIRGMIRKVFDLVKFETVATGAKPKRETVVTYKLGPKPSESKALSKTQQRKAKAAEAKASGAKPKKAAKAAAAKPAAKESKKPAAKKPAKKSKE
ncbi:MAG TPA: 50S ribosomal protein L30 [bacterium]|nr:50S ribosomal protein L30 [bacterium]